MDTLVKKCSKCKEIKDKVSEFSRDKSATDGFYSMCKPCKKQRRKEKFVVEEPKYELEFEADESGEEIVEFVANSDLISVHKGQWFRGKDYNSYKIWEDKKGKYVEMFTPNGSFYFDHSDFSHVTRRTNGVLIKWHMKREYNLKYRVGYYIIGNPLLHTKMYIHQWIMNHYNHGTNITVDHIDRNPLNNRRYNLRLATKSEQSSNVTKRERSCHATKLPKGLKSSHMPKYVSYTRYKRNNKLGYYDFFLIQCHPYQKPEFGQKAKWCTRMKMTIPLKEKLQQALDKLREFDRLYEESLSKKKFKRYIQIAGSS